MNQDYAKIWENCLRITKQYVAPSSFDTWFKPIVPLKLSSNVLTIRVPSKFFCEYLEENYIEVISKAVKAVVGSDAKLEYTYLKNRNNTPESRGKRQSIAQIKKKSDATAKNPFEVGYNIKKVNIIPQVDSKNTFDDFVEGQCNKLARSAGDAIAKEPGVNTYNPLFIYGKSGLGKTHLAQAISLEIKKKFPEKAVVYVSANKFQNQYTSAVRENELNSFINFYQMADALIVDDAQDFANKEKTQRTFFHIFNHLHQLDKQLVLTSDRSPKELVGLDERLLSRFKWGLSAQLTIPDFSTRVKILQRKMNSGVTISDEVLEHIASEITSNIRELEGALNSLLARIRLGDGEDTVKYASEVVSNLVQTTKREVQINSICETVCEYYNISENEFQSKVRKREIVQARQIAMYFAKKLTKLSLSSIGAAIGGKDHATVLHSYKTVNNLKDIDKKFQYSLSEIGQKLIS